MFWTILGALLAWQLINLILWLWSLPEINSDPFESERAAQPPPLPDPYRVSSNGTWNKR